MKQDQLLEGLVLVRGLSHDDGKVIQIGAELQSIKTSPRGEKKRGRRVGVLNFARTFLPTPRPRPRRPRKTNPKWGR